MKKDAIILDLDGVLANSLWTYEFIEEYNYDFNKLYLEKGNRDKLNIEIALIGESFKKMGYEIIILTARKEKDRELTEKWLNGIPFSYDYLLMKKNNDDRKDYIVKKDILTSLLRNFNVKLAIDDRESNIEMFIDSGINTLYFQEGIYK